jgi:hypothetical protein
MNPLRQKVRLEYNSFYIAGSRNVDVPQAIGGAAFATNRHCINVGCRMWHDADIWIALGRPNEVHLAGKPALDWPILTPDRQVLLFDANHPELMRLPAGTNNTRIRVWTNHPTEPDEVIVVVGD